MRVRVIAMGRLKEDFLRSAVAEYQKRLSRYCRLEIVELEPCLLPDRPAEREIAAALEKEGKKILEKIPQGAQTVALCIEGKQLSSEEFAGQVADCAAEGREIALVIGSSYGLSAAVKERVALRLSFSKMTFPHQLFRVLLLEQLYRAFQINAGGEYHK
ncbi:MAG: 23S rRNA (pseudouridine(1915)-N(3))-methyltransferase RlmH [Clostridia bacterium]|nr:23S rRNA (pseudouridine(1915)-N(3))-methyltransferase RlmH [Clostridia bacterium]